jgi:copper homeostasis protein (lipoprotein)
MMALGSLASTVLAAAAALAAQEPAPHAPPPGQQVLGFYTGTLPCADCPGIRTELTLSEGSGRTSYWLKETYLGRPEKGATLESGGSWTVEPAARDPKERVYRLTEARSRTSRFLLKVGDDELRMVDRSGRPIESMHGYTLKRQIVKPESSR